MIYAKTEGLDIIILEPENIMDMKAGKPICTPDKSTLIFFCPDINKLTDEALKRKIIDSEDGSLNPRQLGELIFELKDSPEVNRARHPLINLMDKSHES